MTLARRVFAGSTYFVTRRCCQRLFFLVPRGQVRSIVGYCLTRAAEKHGVLLHQVQVLSNHIHYVATDPQGDLSDFARDAHGWIAKCINAMLGRWESLWTPGRFHARELFTSGDVLARLVYVGTNVVAAGLVETARQWPGLRTLPAHLHQRPMRFQRPPLFSARGPMPDEVELHLTIPPHFDHLSRRAYTDMLQRAIDQEEASLREQMAAQGRTFMGAEAVKRQKRSDSPNTIEPRRKLAPVIACNDPALRIPELEALVAFREAYQDARQRWLAGETPTVFPAGVVQMRPFPGVVVMPDPKRPGRAPPSTPKAA